MMHYSDALFYLELSNISIDQFHEYCHKHNLKAHEIASNGDKWFYKNSIHQCIDNIGNPIDKLIQFV